jgi:hypothetical protein
MPYQSERVRTAALVSFYAAKQSSSKPVDVLKSMLGADEFAGIKAPTQFIRDVVTKWQRHHTVVNLFSMRACSHPKVVPDAIIKECAAKIKGGYHVQLQVADASTDGNGQLRVHSVHRYYTSIREACEKDAYLGGVIREYGVTYEYLRTRLHQVAPELKVRTVEFKYFLTENQRLARRAVATLLLGAWVTDHSFFDPVYWLDETCMWIISNQNPSVKVWADAHDEGVRAVLTSPHIAAHSKIKVHLIAAVNAQLGPVWCDFTTGTTDIERRTLGLNAPYKVSGQYQLYPSDPQLCTQPSNSCCMQCT